MKYLWDTNACIHYLSSTDVAIVQRIMRTGRGNVATRSIVVEELFYGAYRSERVSDNLASVRKFAATFDIWPFDVSAAHESARIRAMLSKAGQSIGPFDNLIAAVALARGATLVTHNLAEFKRIPGLSIEDWQMVH